MKNTSRSPHRHNVWELYFKVLKVHFKNSKFMRFYRARGKVGVILMVEEPGF